MKKWDAGCCGPIDKPVIPPGSTTDQLREQNTFVMIMASGTRYKFLAIQRLFNPIKEEKKTYISYMGEIPINNLEDLKKNQNLLKHYQV